MCFTALRRYGDWGFLALRVVVGIIFIYHGSQKWGFWTTTPGDMSGGMVLLFKLLSIVEPLAGLGLILGIVMDWAALALAIVMVGALFMKITGKMGPEATSFGRWEFDLLLLASNVLFLTNGGGSITVMKK